MQAYRLWAAVRCTVRTHYLQLVYICHPSSQ